MTNSSTDTAELIKFVVDRLDEDKQRRRGHRPASPAVEEPADHAVEFAMKRRILSHAQRLAVLRDQPNERAVRAEAVGILRALAAPYCAHPAYRAEWHVSTR